jgi:Holliday junction resolvasome RuvABC ATP-dependent DNA helicase subunit
MSTVSFNRFTSIELVIPSRFSSKPPHPNTFLNFQPAANAASHLSEAARFTAPTGNRLLQTNVDFQAEDKAKKLNLQQARTDLKRANVDNLANKIFQADVKKETMYSGKLQ